MTTVDNAATRLRTQVLAARTSGNTLALDFWCKRWGLDRGTLRGRLECTRLGASLAAAAVECRELAEGMDDRFAYIALQNFHQVEGVVDRFGLLPQITVDSFFSGLDTSGVTSVELLEEIFIRNAGSPMVEVRALDDLIIQCRQLMDGLRNSDLPLDVVLELVERISDVEQALQRIDICGPQPAMQAADGLMGVFTRLYLRGATVANHPVARVGLILAISVANGLDVAANYTQLAGSDIGQVIGLPGGSTPNP